MLCWRYSNCNPLDYTAIAYTSTTHALSSIYSTIATWLGTIECYYGMLGRRDGVLVFRSSPWSLGLVLGSAIRLVRVRRLMRSPLIRPP
ncbi:hypothetical protein F5Y10DRAFT_238011 [Nemania abortiva]|nr:hypothetical protein F5Y10DRAFT_238011 [Nemania abortiva]